MHARQEARTGAGHGCLAASRIFSGIPTIPDVAGPESAALPRPCALAAEHAARGRPLTAALRLALASSPPAGADGREGDERFRSFLELRQEKMVRQQWDLSCGAAALATVLN